MFNPMALSSQINRDGLIILDDELFIGYHGQTKCNLERYHNNPGHLEAISVPADSMALRDI